MATPLLVITNAGLAAASTATPVGPFIKIVGFAVGSAYDYEVTPDQTALNGELLYEGLVSSYAYIGDNTINIVCKIPADAGPFEFGEVALYMEDANQNRVMFAKAAFDTPQLKSTSLGTNLALVYTFNCLMKLAQSVAVFQIVSADGQPQPVLSIDRWSDVIPPALSASPDQPLLIVKELDSKGQSSLLVNTDDEKWTIASAYYYLDAYTVQASSLTFVQIPFAEWNQSVDLLTQSLVLETGDGFFRAVSSIDVIGTTGIRFTLSGEPLPTLPIVGDKCILHLNSAGTTIQPLTPNTALIADAQARVASSSVTSDELASLEGVTDNVQNQLDDKLSLTGGRLTGPVEAVSFSSYNSNNLNFGFNGATKAAITTTGLNVTGAIHATGDITAFSDERLKNDRKVIENALSKVGKLKGYSYVMNGKQNAGLLAQEVQKVLPESITEIDDLLALNYNAVIALLVQAINELSRKVGK